MANNLDPSVVSDLGLHCLQRLIYIPILRFITVFFLFFLENICCENSVEEPCRGFSNEYPQHAFMKKKAKYFSYQDQYTLYV